MKGICEQLTSQPHRSFLLKCLLHIFRMSERTHHTSQKLITEERGSTSMITGAALCDTGMLNIKCDVSGGTSFFSRGALTLTLVHKVSQQALKKQNNRMKIHENNAFK